MSSEVRFTNHLAPETSPYLRQHAHNPVDWFPWGEESLAKARQLDRPIFLSIGYSACHWCHVMERESFENETIAAILNEHFISIKVDREERPDLDQIYMTSVQLMTGQGGWPMSVFLTPDLRPFTGGTYFPPEDRFGRPGFRRVLLTLADYWENRRPDIDEAAAKITDHIRDAGKLRADSGDLQESLLRQAVVNLRRSFDPVHGGFGPAPKFPHPMDLRFLFRAWRRFDDAGALHMARHTLDRMAMGGIYDHLGGGFARYSTDARWLAPHFEKMLYDNALLVPGYLEAFQATGEPFYRTIVEETLAWVLREMTSQEGPFFSTLDADSEGEEGKFYVWSNGEITDILGPEESSLFKAVYNVEPEGNWEGHNILHRVKTFEQIAKLWKIPENELHQRLADSRQKLLNARAWRIRPGLDDKVLTAWNGLMIGALAQAAQVLAQPEYATAACRAASFILANMRTPEGRLLRTWSPGSSAKLNAYLEDYAFLIDGLVTLYEATFDRTWLQGALDLSLVMVDQFWDEAEGGFFFTGRDHEKLISRTKDPLDNATPSGNAMAVTALLRLVHLTDRADLQEKAERTLRIYRGLLESHPTAASQMLIAFDFLLGPVQEFAIVGDLESEETRRVLKAIHGNFRPGKVVAVKMPGPVPEDALLPLLADKAWRGQVTTFVCANFTCQVPLIGAQAAEEFLASDAK